MIQRGTSALAGGLLAVRHASPYRISPSPAVPEACAGPARRARSTPSRGAWAASFVVHAAALGALWLTQTPLNATVPLDPEEPRSADDLYVHADARLPGFPRLNRYPTWFDFITPLTLEAPPLTDEALPPSEAVECATEPHHGWSRLQSSYLAVDDRDTTLRLIRAAERECANQSALAGWSGRGRIFVRVNRREDGAASATIAALGDDARDEALLCCLREAQETVASMLRPGGALRYVLVFSADPAQRHLRLDHSAASRGGGGPEALAMVQSAFTE